MRLRFVLALGILVVAGILALMFLFRVDRELECLAKNVYFEARLQSELGQRLVAHVTMERYREQSLRFGRPAICDVVYYKKHNGKDRVTPAFSWTLLPKAQQVPRNKEKWRRALQIAREVRDGAWKPDARFVSAKWYMNQKFAQRRNICWFKSTLVSIAKEGDHEFFREARSDSERLGLLALDPEECKPPKKKKKQASR